MQSAKVSGLVYLKCKIFRMNKRTLPHDYSKQMTRKQVLQGLQYRKKRKLQYRKQRKLKTILRLLFLSNNTPQTLPFLHLKLQQDEFILTELPSLAWLSQYLLDKGTLRTLPETILVSQLKEQDCLQASPVSKICRQEGAR